MPETTIFDFGDPYGAFSAFLISTALGLYIGWHFWKCFSVFWKHSESVKKQNLAKSLEKSYFLERAHIRQEAMERLGINHDKDTWIIDMRFWWPLWCILPLLWNWSMWIRSFKERNLAKVLVFQSEDWCSWCRNCNGRKKVSKIDGRGANWKKK